MDISVNFEQKGGGAPLVLLHGNGESHGYFAGQLDFFSLHYRVLAPDTRGHGKTPRGAGAFTLDRFAEDLKGFLDCQAIKKTNLLGFSDGGNIALLFALKYPEYVDKLILNGANLSPKGVKLSVQLPVLAGYGIVSLIALADKNAAAKKEVLRLMVNQPHIPPEALASLDIPTLVIAGTRDMIKDSHTRAIAAALPKGRLVLIPGDHFIANKNSAPFNQAVLEFLQGE